MTLCIMMFLGLSFCLFFHYCLTTSYQSHLPYHYHILLLMIHHHSHSFLHNTPVQDYTTDTFVLYWILRRHSMEACMHAHLLNSCTLVHAQYEFLPKWYYLVNLLYILIPFVILTTN